MKIFFQTSNTWRNAFLHLYVMNSNASPTLNEFIEKFDNEESICLLIGKRAVGDDYKNRLVALGKLLASATRYTRFRSGNAGGADELFISGVASVAPERVHLFLPYRGHRKRTVGKLEASSLDEIDLLKEPELIYNTKRVNAKNSSLIDKYTSGDRDRFAIKAAYLLRDSLMVLGNKNLPKASVVVYFDDLSTPLSGGTGHTVILAKNNGIPCIDQTNWLNWL